MGKYNVLQRVSDGPSARAVSGEWLGKLNELCGEGEGLQLSFLETQALRDFLQFVRSAFWALEYVECIEVFDELLGARILRYDASEHIFLAWYGGHGIHAYCATTGREVAFWNVGNFAHNDARCEVVRASMDEHIQGGGYPWANPAPF